MVQFVVVSGGPQEEPEFEDIKRQFIDPESVLVLRKDYKWTELLDANIDMHGMFYGVHVNLCESGETHKLRTFLVHACTQDSEQLNIVYQFSTRYPNLQELQCLVLADFGRYLVKARDAGLSTIQ